MGQLRTANLRTTGALRPIVTAEEFGACELGAGTTFMGIVN
ncbi:MAG: hypothetical protein K0S66_2961 [Sphingomonas sp.]|nr:hypothetical protein [Sphingomonas sp.]